MVFKLIFLIVILVLFSFFTGFNLDNKSNIWLFFKTYENVPVFMNTLISFAFGLLMSLPIALSRKFRYQKKMEQKLEEAKREKTSKKKSDKDDDQKIIPEKKTKRESILDKIQNLKKRPLSPDAEKNQEFSEENDDN